MSDIYCRQRQDLINKVTERLGMINDSTVAQSILRRRRNLRPSATRVMEAWFERNKGHPYPSKKERALLASAASVTEAQVHIYPK